MSHGDVAFDTGGRNVVETISRHRCALPIVTRRRRLGRFVSCACGTTYQLKCTTFGRGWWPVSSRDETVRGRRALSFSDAKSIGLAP